MAARNIELKARLHDLYGARARARAVATDYVGVQQQTDTYFQCSSGRLKLREIVGRTAQLVWYQRPNQGPVRASDYLLVDVPQPEQLKQALTSALEIQVVVAKQREVFLHHNVRIHLDEVEGLGTFLEFEAVLEEGVDDAAGHAQVARLRLEFEIADADCIADSYADLLLRKS